MSRDDIRKLAGGYIAGSLTAEEQRALLEAALNDQSLFDELARDEALRDLLSDPASRAYLLTALDEPLPAWHRRMASWVWERAVGVGALACFVVAAGYFAWQARVVENGRSRIQATEPTTVEVVAKAGSRRAFDVDAATKAAERKLPPLPPPPAAKPVIAAGQRRPLPAFISSLPAPLAPPPPKEGNLGDVTVSAQAAPAQSLPSAGPMAAPRVTGAVAGAAGAPAVQSTAASTRQVALVPSQTNSAELQAQAETQQKALQAFAVRSALRADSVALIKSASADTAADRRTLTAKSTPQIAALAERARAGEPLTAEDNRLMSGGEVNVRLMLTSYSVADMSAIRELGFTVTRQNQAEVEGHIAPEKLFALARLAMVFRITAM